MLQIDLSQELNTELETRRQEALSIAKYLIQILKQKFGATEAFICGSLIFNQINPLLSLSEI